MLPLDSSQAIATPSADPVENPRVPTALHVPEPGLVEVVEVVLVVVVVVASWIVVVVAPWAVVVVAPWTVVVVVVSPPPEEPQPAKYRPANTARQIITKYFFIVPLLVF